MYRRCRFDDGVALCESLLELCPESCTLRDALADLHIRNGNGEQAVSMWLHALAECPNNAEVFYHCCSFLMAQVSLLYSVWEEVDHGVESSLTEPDVRGYWKIVFALLTGEVWCHPSALQRVHPESV